MGNQPSVCQKCNNEYKGYWKQWFPTSGKVSNNERISAYYVHCCGCKNYRVNHAVTPCLKMVTGVNQCNVSNSTCSFPSNGEWNHCCKCQMDYPDDGYHYNGNFGKEYSYVHCCSCKVVYDHEMSNHCCNCGMVFDNRINHVCKK